ncbi:MAG: hypothetical protein K9N05_02260 [Candidatus Marinimicrobia bacterium]|nr:hypothetical protein [Candidatus Neomarinimicrobiota bacterium]
MSGAKLKYIILFTVFFAGVNAAVWHIGSSFPCAIRDGPLAYAQAPALFPDTLCVASVWSPVYRGFGVQEGMIYMGARGFDLSLKTQYHALMSNHQLTFGFPILRETTIKAGLQLHYTLSALHGVNIWHKGSCSGGMLLTPNRDWKISLYSQHLLSFPRDSTEHLLEACSGFAVAYFLQPELNFSITMQKRFLLPWQMFFGIYYQAWRALAFSVQYEITEHQWEASSSICLGRWSVQAVFRHHLYLGFSQQYVIAYVC